MRSIRWARKSSRSKRRGAVAPRRLLRARPCAPAAGSAAGAGRRRAPSCRRSSSASVQSSSGRGSPSASSESTTRAMRAPSPAWIASMSVSRSKRETSVTASRIAVERDLALRAAAAPSFSTSWLRGEEVALDAVGEPLERLDAGASGPGARGARRATRAARRASRRLASTTTPARLERLEPLGLLLLPVELGQRARASPRRRAGVAHHASIALPPSVPGLPVGMRISTSASRRRARGSRADGAEAAPVGAGLGEEDLALGAAVAPRGLADAVGGLEREQRLGAVHRRRAGARPLLQVRARAGAWRSSRLLAPRDRDLAQDPVGELDLHVRKSSCSSASFAIGAVSL